MESAVRGDALGLLDVAPWGELAGPWGVTFDPKWSRLGATLTFDTLIDWTQRPEAGIKYFPGRRFIAMNSICL